MDADHERKGQAEEGNLPRPDIRGSREEEIVFLLYRVSRLGAAPSIFHFDFLKYRATPMRIGEEKKTKKVLGSLTILKSAPKVSSVEKNSKIEFCLSTVPVVGLKISPSPPRNIARSSARRNSRREATPVAAARDSHRGRDLGAASDVGGRFLAEIGESEGMRRRMRPPPRST
jgi:hypothetical protein